MSDSQHNSQNKDAAKSTTPGQAEGTENLDQQSETSPAPTTPGTAEGGRKEEDSPQK